MVCYDQFRSTVLHACVWIRCATRYMRVSFELCRQSYWRCSVRSSHARFYIHSIHSFIDRAMGRARYLHRSCSRRFRVFHGCEDHVFWASSCGALRCRDDHMFANDQIICAFVDSNLCATRNDSWDYLFVYVWTVCAFGLTFIMWICECTIKLDLTVAAHSFPFCG